VYDAVIFDNDGVLVELADRTVLRGAAARTFAELGVDPREEHVDEIVVGVTEETLYDLCATYDLDPETFWATRDRLISEAQRDLLRDGKTGLYDDFDAVHAVDAPLGIVSSNQQATVDFMLDHFGTRELFVTAYGRPPTVESLGLKKPNAHYVERALADVGVEEALFVGDSASDVEAAHRAGLDSAFVRRPHRAGATLDVTPTYELRGLRDLLRIGRVPTRRVASDAASDD
jgi:phosphoglycolate phosphatase-like HAD superfamily hydrolase